MDPITQQIEALKAQLSETELEEFEAHYRTKLTEATQAAQLADATTLAVDQDQIERQVLDDLIRTAEGRDNADGLGRVTCGGLVYAIHVPEREPRLEASAGRPRTSTTGATPTAEMTPARWIAVALVLLVLLGYGLVTIWGSTPIEVSADVPPIAPSGLAPTSPPVLPTTLGELGEAGAATVADPTSLEIRRADGSSVVLRVVPSSGVLGGSWTPTVEDGQAAWLSGTMINSVFCLPGNATNLISALKRGSPIVMRPASGALRHYEVIRTRTVGRQQVEVLDQRRAGMTLLACGGTGSTRTVVEAVYRPQTVQRPIQALGTNAALSDLARVQLQRVEVLPATADLPPGLSVAALTVEIANLSSAELAWSDLADHLEIAGSVAETVPSVPQAPLGPNETRRVSYRYRVPSRGGDALWRVTAATGDSVTVRVTIPPAPVVSRLVVTLRPDEVQQRGSGDQARIAIAATVRNTGTEPITLEPATVGVWQGATALPLNDETTPLPLLLPPGESETLRLVVDRPDDPAALTLQIGVERWRVTLP
jgi:hypothetical protein